MPKPKSKSNKDSSQPETPSAPEQQLLSIKPKRPQQDLLVDADKIAEKTSVQPVEQRLLGIKPKKTEEVAPSETSLDEQTQVVKPPVERRLESKAPEVTPLYEKRILPVNAENQEDKLQKPAFQKPQLKKPQPPPYKNLEEVTTSSGETFVVGEQVKVTTANYGEYSVAIKFIYEAADGSVWASYSHTNKEQRHPWRWGCCRVDLLKKELNE
ncbi:hypothetical protein NIES4071_60430 [Calothrix sp. NIES-4071]|nr:hypothetical protein NIES4071_60430 [Calothrix sp. NIES-4071]BAZ60350.1 hypothetical protein NIES4105_60380 [Calothrix sp. NIES-4105]